MKNKKEITEKRFLKDVGLIDNPVRRFLAHNLNREISVYYNGDENGIEGLLLGFNDYLNIILGTKTGPILFRNYDRIKVKPYKKPEIIVQQRPVTQKVTGLANEIEKV